MVDTVYWTEGDEDHLHEKILLGGILKDIDEDHKEEDDDEEDDEDG